MLNAIAYHVFHKQPTHAEPLRGGDINRAGRIEIDGMPYFVKYKADAPPRFFETEAKGLNLLRSSAPLRVPEVIAYSEANDEIPAYLMLEWVNTAVPSPGFPAKFGMALAQLHRVTAATFGLDDNNYIGELPQSNHQTHDWVDFYREQRLLPQIALARRKGILPPQREASLMRLMERFDDWLGGINRVPSLLHGDLWAGNFVVATNDEPVIVDPAVYYGDREVEIAFTELFGGFPSGFLAAYRDSVPLEPGYEQRRSLYHLYPLLVHFNLFGEMYGVQIDVICRRYL